MKPLLVILALGSIAALTSWWLASPPPQVVAWPAPSERSSPRPSQTITDPAQVFQRAFWKRPASGDEILQAERREWKDADAITRWQWFIQVKPSPGLLKHLITANAFNLSPVSTPAPVANAPAWFIPGAGFTQVLRARGGHMQLLFDPQANTLLATDSGGGFHKGASEALKPVAQTNAPASRLPRTPPPKMEMPKP